MLHKNKAPTDEARAGHMSSTPFSRGLALVVLDINGDFKLDNITTPHLSAMVNTRATMTRQLRSQTVKEEDRSRSRAPLSPGKWLIYHLWL